ncbi:ribonuclease H-like protein [Annulohypoxylon maeteangense]|uniref:ribonuclease H-like protein n=1 Tax=Annulohypoxylon maeteangense TaxID=1927788 RepID=UPI002007DE12|nr:ribonuclease H-like protein [Annulohypoxylon maeteangense]KAI0887029.1 ribonuclease H-like protein [Annulohypoxylon maeteangense]
MAQSKGHRKLRCDCALIFDTPPSFTRHVFETGHMRHRWCTVCDQLFGSKEGLQQHNRAATTHQLKPTTPPKPNASFSDKKSQAEKPKTTPKKSAPAPATKSPKTATKSKKATKSPTKVPISANSNASQPSGVIQMSMPTSQMAPLAQPPNPLLTNYPWVSGRQDASLIKAATNQCHSESRLIEQGYYTGDPAYRGHHKFSIVSFASAPARVKGLMKRRGIALDCEMVGVAGDKDELAHLCAVDLFTGEVLVNSLVAPTQPVKDWRTRWSGVTPAKMAIAKASGQFLDGWPAARAKLFQFVDADTILVGHALNHDLRVLHIAHKQVIDSGILVAEAAFGRAQRLRHNWGLKRATQQILGLKIQTSKKGHDCLEDTLASRELVLWCLKEPVKLLEWGRNALIKYEEDKLKQQERERAKAKAKKEKEEKEQKEKEKEKQTPFPLPTPGARNYGDYDYGYDDNYDHDYYDDDFDYDYAHLHGTGNVGGYRFYDYYQGRNRDNDPLWADPDY